jgi:4-hydroxy-tetrahydrodipicolinate synthase
MEAESSVWGGHTSRVQHAHGGEEMKDITPSYSRPTQSTSASASSSSHLSLKSPTLLSTRTNIVTMGSVQEVQKAPKIDLAGLVPAPVTPFNLDGSIDYAAIQRLGSWLGSIPGVKGLVVLGHAGEGTFLTQEEQVDVIKAFVKSVDNKIPIIAGITTEGTEVAALEAQRAKAAGAQAGLLYPSHGWLRFGYQEGAPQDRYKVVYEKSGLPLILFQYPDNTKATYSLKTLLDIAAQPGVIAMKNGVRSMTRWDTEIPVIKAKNPDLTILTCHDEHLLHTVFDVDGMLVGYGNIAPEPLLEMIEAGKARDYPRARALHDRLLPVTKSVYHRGSHMEGTVALKHALVARGILEHATVRSALLPLPDGAEQEIHSAIKSASLGKAVVPQSK